MSKRVLLVDDEQCILTGIERNMDGQFCLSTACSGLDALAAMDEYGPFALIVTDMRMPNMDGMQFIKEARVKSPDTVFIMLTGNQDQATAIQALNEGHVFRFLNKPCEGVELVRAVEDGLRQYELVTSERELLHDTICGAVSVFTDLLELSLPKIFDRAGGIQDIAMALSASLGLVNHWEYKLAAQLGFLGFALLPDNERAGFEVGVVSGAGMNQRFSQAAATGQVLLERIPRLDTVAYIIGMQFEIDGSALIHAPKNQATKWVMGATLLRVSMLWDDILRRGMHGMDAINELRRTLPNLSAEMADALLAISADNGDEAGVEVRICDLKEGMLLFEDVLSDDGSVLVRKGRRLTWIVIERLRNIHASGDRSRSIRILESTSTMSDRLIMA